MKITMMLDQQAMNKGRKPIFFRSDDNHQSEHVTVKQAETVIKIMRDVNVFIENKTGLTF